MPVIVANEHMHDGHADNKRIEGNYQAYVMSSQRAKIRRDDINAT